MVSLRFRHYFLKLILAVCATAVVACSPSSLELPSVAPTILSGKIEGYNSGSASFSTASSSSSSSSVAAQNKSSSENTSINCSSATVSLYQLDSSGSKIEPALQTTPLSADGTYSFNIKQSGVSVKGQKVLESYLVTITGCSAGVYSRPITGSKDQNISMGSTILSYLLNTNNKQTFAAALKNQATSVDQLIAQLSNASTLEGAYQELTQSSTATSKFTELFGTPPNVLTNAAPEVQTLDVPEQGSELVPIPLSITSSHWSSQFSPAIEWDLDGVIISRNSSFSYTPDANSQGTRTITLRIGTPNSQNAIDIDKPIKTITKQIRISNNILPSPPLFSIESPVVVGNIPINSRSLQLSLATGTQKVNCSSFSDLAITENQISPPTSSQFTMTCQNSPVQNFNFNLISGGDGLKTLRLWSRDSAGTITTNPRVISFYLDTGAPSTQILTSLSGLSSSSSQNISFTAEDNGGSIDHYECKLDQGSWSQCSSPKAYSQLTEGSHEFSVKSFDTAGNSSTISYLQWTIDLSPPIITISSAPSLNTQSMTSVFSLSASDSGGGQVVGLQCKIDSGSWENCQSPYTVILGIGSHTFSARALDSAGNSSAIQTHSWVIDTQAPIVTLASQPSSITNNTSATFSWTANDIGGGQVDFFECSRDSTAFSRCISPLTLSDLHDGSHQFSIRATDTAGNRSNSISTSWTIDTTTPMASVTSGPNSLSNLTSATFVFSANPPPDGNITGYECQLDSGAWSGCSSPKSYSNQTEGLHQFSVRSIDNFNRRSPSRTRTWTIDLTPPSLSLNSSINLITQQTSVEFQFSGTDTNGIASYVCRLDSNIDVACSSPQSFSNLSAGVHTFYVKALDLAGNLSTISTTTWTIDQTPPNVSINSHPNTLNNSSSGILTFSGSDSGGGTIQNYLCRLDSAPESTCSSPFNFSNLGEGSHSFSVRSQDSAGNYSGSQTFTWVVDLTAPTTQITSSPANPNSMTTARLTFSGTDSGGGTVATFTCQLDQNTASVCSSPTDLTNLSEGSHQFSVFSTDSAGNQGLSETVKWTIDRTAPVLSISAPSSNGTVIPASSISNYLLSGACTEENRSVTISGPMTVTTTCTSGGWSAYLNLSGISDGTLNFTASQNDIAGNTGTSSTRTIIKDTVAPQIAINTPQILAGNINTASLGWTLTESNALAANLFLIELYQGTQWISLGTLPPQSGSNNNQSYTKTALSIPSVSTNQAQFRISITDAAGNTTQQTSSTFTIDSTPPTISSFVLAGGVSQVNTPTVGIQISASDNAAGVTEMRISESSTYANNSWQTFANSSTYTLSMTSGAKTVYLWVKDAVGNISLAASQNISLDFGSPPVLAITGPSNNNLFSSGSTLSIAWSCTANVGLPALPIKEISYTTDNGATFTSITTNLPNNDSATTGHYDWSLPSSLVSTPFRIWLKCESASGSQVEKLSDVYQTNGTWSIWAGQLSAKRDGVLGYGANKLVLNTCSTGSIDKDGNIFYTTSTSTYNSGNTTALMKINSTTGLIERVVGDYTASAAAGGEDLTSGSLSSHKIVQKNCSGGWPGVILGTSADRTEILFLDNGSTGRVYGISANGTARLYATFPFAIETISYWSKRFFLSKNKILFAFYSGKLYRLDLSSPGNTPVWIYGTGTNNAAVTIAVGTEGTLAPLKTYGTGGTANTNCNDCIVLSNPAGTRIWVGGGFGSAPGSTGMNTWAQLDQNASDSKYYVTSETYPNLRLMNNAIASDFDNKIYARGRDATSTISVFDTDNPGTVTSTSVNGFNGLTGNFYFNLFSSNTNLYFLDVDQEIKIINSTMTSSSLIAGNNANRIGDNLSRQYVDFINVRGTSYDPTSGLLTISQNANARFYNFNNPSAGFFSSSRNVGQTTRYSSAKGSNKFLYRNNTGNLISLNLDLTNRIDTGTTGYMGGCSGCVVYSTTWDYQIQGGIPDGTSSTGSGGNFFSLASGTTGSGFEAVLSHSNGNTYFQAQSTTGYYSYIYVIKSTDSKIYKLAGYNGIAGYNSSQSGSAALGVQLSTSIKYLYEIRSGTYAGDILFVDNSIVRRLSVATESASPKIYDLVDLKIASNFSATTVIDDIVYDESSEISGVKGTGAFYYVRTSPTLEIHKWQATNSNFSTAVDTKYTPTGLTLSGSYRLAITPDGLLATELSLNRILRLPP